MGNVRAWALQWSKLTLGANMTLSGNMDIRDTTRSWTWRGTRSTCEFHILVGMEARPRCSTERR